MLWEVKLCRVDKRGAKHEQTPIPSVGRKWRYKLAGPDFLSIGEAAYPCLLKKLCGCCGSKVKDISCV